MWSVTLLIDITSKGTLEYEKFPRPWLCSLTIITLSYAGSNEITEQHSYMKSSLYCMKSAKSSAFSSSSVAHVLLEKMMNTVQYTRTTSNNWSLSLRVELFIKNCSFCYEEGTFLNAALVNTKSALFRVRKTALFVKEKCKE